MLAAPTPLADERTLEALDFASVRARVIGATRTQRGKAQAANLTPSADFSQVRTEQARTNATRDLVAGADLHVMSASDTADMTQAANLGRTLAAGELRTIGDTLASAAAAYQAVREDVTLAPVTSTYTSLRDLQRSIVEGIDERGAVLDRASPALGRIRRNLSQAQADARDRVGAIVRSAKYARVLQDNVVTIREGRFVVPIKAEFSGEFPGIVHDTSSSGQTLFVEPLAALDTNNRVRTLRIEEEREVQRILEDFSRRVGSEAHAIERNVDMLAAIDLLVAKAEVARAMDARAPELTDAAAIAVENGRHPLLGERAVAQSLALDATTRLLVISGPNMGGKTVALKMVGLFVLMAYCGMQVPAAAGTIVGKFARVVADIGDDQSIAANTSTFSAHLERMREMLESADAATLVLVDEIGGGTEPSAGAALAIAMLERLLECGARGLVTTHATELKLFAHALPGVANASVRFDPQNFKPTFHLDIGAPGQSLAFPLAQTIGIDGAIVQRAQQLLDNRERDYEAALAELSLRNAQLQQQQDALAHERRSADRAATELASERVALDAQRRTFATRAEERMQQALRDFVNELQRRDDERPAKRPKVAPSQAALLAETIEAMRRDLGIGPEPAPAGEDGTFAPGDQVRVISLQQDATVVEDYGESLLLAIGPMKTVVKKSDARRHEGARPRRARVSEGGGDARVNAATRTQAELDVRGKRFVEAEPLVERWIDEAVLAGNSPLRLIHGKGTGMLGRGLQEHLRAHPSVSGVRYGTEEEGSSGVTIVDLRQ
ncbi:MAG: endonuclease MutS2 [Candidatus Eremiobacteraeota bacterium]|nr:endonuclease MutS2 [Candidatus Eremiobacteraeota bacterium]